MILHTASAKLHRSALYTSGESPLQVIWTANFEDLVRLSPFTGSEESHLELDALYLASTSSSGRKIRSRSLLLFSKFVPSLSKPSLFKLVYGDTRRMTTVNSRCHNGQQAHYFKVQIRSETEALTPKKISTLG